LSSIDYLAQWSLVIVAFRLLQPQHHYTDTDTYDVTYVL